MTAEGPPGPPGPPAPPAPPASLSPERAAPARPSRREGHGVAARVRPDPDTLAVAMVALCALVFAGAALAAYFAAPDLLWRGVHHDRNGHFAYGVDLALSLRQGDLFAFLQSLERAKVWPPVHGLVLGAVLLFGGIDHRLGIVPSLIGWVMTVVFAALIARLMFADRLRRALAAVVAGLLVMASPTFRLLGADVMLEGLGAGFSAWALWSYARADAAPQERRRWRMLALALTALFFLKGNYWGLVVAAIAIAALTAAPRGGAERARAWAKAAGVGALARAGLRDPLLLACAALAALIAILYWRGPAAFSVFGRSVSLYPPENLTTLAYALLFLRVALAWRRHRAALEALLGTPGHALFYWHAVPVAISFLAPKRLSAFLGFIGPGNAPLIEGRPGGLAIYWSAFSQGFHPAVWVAVLTLALFVVGLTQYRRFSPGARAVFVLALVGTAAVLMHPHQQDRFLASWIFAVWVGAGAGAAVLAGSVLGKRPPRPQAAAAALAIALVPALAALAPPFARLHAGRGAGPSDLALIRPAFPALAGARAVAVVATFGRNSFFPWAIRENCRCRVPVDAPWLEGLPSREAVRDALAAYAAQTASDRLVLVDAPGSRDAGAPLSSYAIMAGILDGMEGQRRFVRALDHAVPEHGAQVTVWRRAGR